MTIEIPESVVVLFRRLFSQRCQHRFALDDLRMVNPDGDKDRVEWPCADCGQVFRAHCGLDISPSNGPTFRRNQEIQA